MIVPDLGFFPKLFPRDHCFLFSIHAICEAGFLKLLRTSASRPVNARRAVPSEDDIESRMGVCLRRVLMFFSPSFFL